jgi:kynureninase
MNELAAHYTRFGVSERVLLTGHSHQAWPDVAREGQLEAFDDAAQHVDAKWTKAMAKAERVRAGFRVFLNEPKAEIALGASTHELVLKLLSCLDIMGQRTRLVTTTGEFHTLRRQLGRLGEMGLEVERVPAHPVDTLAARLATAVDERTAAVFVSSVLFESSHIVPELPLVAKACARVGAELLVDAYHQVGVAPFSVRGLERAWVVGGGYKYLQLGEGNCFLRLPSHADKFRPVITGWYTQFDSLTDERASRATTYAKGAARFAGATYDPTSHYRAARVFDFFAEQGLTPDKLRAISLHQTKLIAQRLGLPDDRERFGGFVALRTPHAAEWCEALRKERIHTDVRGHVLRLGPAPYVSDDQLHHAMDVLVAMMPKREN